MIRLGIRVRADDAELTFARLLGFLGAGAEERAAGDAVEYALYGLPGELPDDGALRAAAGDALFEVVREPVADGWERAWHAYLARARVGALCVRPPWVPGEPGDLVIDPGLTFGAGAHATTRLCLAALQQLDPGGPLCDWGAGSGVLAIAGARLGFEPVAAVELDAAAVDTIAANARTNGVAVDARVLDLTRAPAPWAATVVANLTLPLLEAAAAVVERPPRRLVASGVLAAQADHAAAAWAGHGLVERSRRVEDGWAALVLEAA